MKPPLTILIIGWLFVVVGAAGIIAGFWRSDLFAGGSLHSDDMWAILSGVVALAGGILVLRSIGLGRWMILAWLVFHVVLSWLHTFTELIIHAALLLLIGYFLLRPQASVFFRRV
jgi:hypothetical protein